MATLRVPSSTPTPAQDSDHLRNSFVGLGTNEAQTIKILAHRNAAQRKLIRDTYSANYGKDLLNDLEAELSGDFLRATQLWTMDPVERDVLLIHEATTKGSNSNNWVIMEIACTRSSFELINIRQAYHIHYKRSLEEDVAQHTIGDFRKDTMEVFDLDCDLFDLTRYTVTKVFDNALTLTKFHTNDVLHFRFIYRRMPLHEKDLTFLQRYEGDDVNLILAKSEAKILHEKISKKAFKDDEIIRVLATRSKPQLNATFNQYNDLFGNAINKSLKDDPKNEYLKLLRATIKCLTFPEKYFEKVLRFAVKRLGTDEQALTRVVTTRAEFDLARIKEVFHKRNNIPLDNAISGDTSGDYEKILLALSGHEEY